MSHEEIRPTRGSEPPSYELIEQLVDRIHLGDHEVGCLCGISIVLNAVAVAVDRGSRRVGSSQFTVRTLYCSVPFRRGGHRVRRSPGRTRLSRSPGHHSPRSDTLALGQSLTHQTRLRLFLGRVPGEGLTRFRVQLEYRLGDIGCRSQGRITTPTPKGATT